MSAKLPGCGELDGDGWLTGARRVDSPNFDARPDGETVSLIVVHAISLPPREFGGDAIERLFTNTLDPDAHPYFATISALRVSAHFLIRRDGELLQFVSCARRAWHAGVSAWNGRPRCNDFSLGIELEGCDDLPFEELQYRRLAELIAVLRAHYPLSALAGHSDIAPGRKTDPGPFFDWRRVGVGEGTNVRTTQEAYMAATAKGKTDPADAAPAEPVAQSKTRRKASAVTHADKVVAGDKKTAGKKKAAAKPAGKDLAEATVKVAGKRTEKPAEKPAKVVKRGHGVGAAKGAKAGKAAAAPVSPVNPVTTWPFPLEPRPQ